MGKIRRFLGLLTTLAMVFFAANSFAAGYTCDTTKTYTSCNTDYYLSSGSCLECSPKNGATTSSTVDLALGSNMTKKTATCTKTCTGATSGSNGSSQCCSYGDCSYSNYSCTCKSGYTENNPDSASCSCSCTTLCTAVSNTTSTQSCERDCSVSGGSCYYSGSKQTCTGKYTSDGCSSAGASCSGCSAWGDCTGGERYITCPAKTYWNGSSCASCGTGYICPGFTDVKESSLSNGYGRTQCPANYRDGSAVTVEGDCLGAFQKSGSQETPALPTGWANRTLTDCQVGTCTYYKKYSGTVTQDCTPNNCTKGQTCTSAVAGYYLNSSAGTCDKCDTSYPSSDGGTVTSGYCYTSCASGYSGRNYKSATDTCSCNTLCKDKLSNATQTCTPSNNVANAYKTSCPSGTQSCTGYYTNDACSSANEACSGCTAWGPCSTTCTAASCKGGYYLSSGACYGCDSGYTSNDGMTGGRNSCYRSCTTSDVANSASVSGTITYGGTSGCKATSCKAGYYLTSSGTCSPCDTGYTSDNGMTGGSGACYRACTTSDVSGASAVSGYISKNGTTVNSCKATSCQSSYYFNSGACPSCTSNDSTYPLSNGGTNGAAYCFRNCTTADVANSKTVSGTVTKAGVSTCAATACNGTKYYLSGGGCQSCPTNAVCDGDDSWSCATGYQKTSSGLGCEPKTYTVTLNDNGGSGGSGTVTATYGSVLPTVKVPTRTNYNFLGYYTATTGGTQYINSNGVGIVSYTTDGTMELYAQWSLGVFTCTSGKASDGTACSAGYYCPGGDVQAGTETSTTSGCERKCPTDTTGGGTVSSPASSTSISACYTTRPNTETPNKTGSGDQLCEYGVSGSDNYAGACKTTITSCVGGRYRRAIDDTECEKADIGYYSPNGDIKLYACSDLPGADNTVKTEATGSDAATDCYNTCSNIAITNGTCVPNPTYVYYNDTKIPACSYKTSCISDGYSPSSTTCSPSSTTCNPKVLKITLDHNGGSSSTNTIYLKYNTGWYSNEGATTKITSVPVPTLTGKTFSGYLSGNTVVANASGVLTTDYTVFDAAGTIKASFDQNASITCAKGTYYKGWGTACTDCPAGSYCEGTETIQGGATESETVGESGRKTCSSLSGTYTAATNASGTKLTVSVSSATKSDAASDCYATDVAYKSSTGRASGSQTCYYNEATGAYTSSCTSVSVSTCISGYYWVSGDDCTKVGTGYYSGEGALTRSTCPGFGIGSNQVTTDSETSGSITACKMGEIWATVSYGAQRQRCTHKSTAPSSLSDVSGYLDNCEKGVIVVCDGGYYLASDSDTACSEVGENYYSPAQSACSGEAAQPLSSAPGCSIKRTACPDGGSTNGATTSDSVEDCGVCPAGSVCTDEGTFTCSELTGGKYTLSDAGTTDVSGCYKSNTMTCIDPGIDVDCPANSLSCAYITGQKVPCRTYYNTSTCVPEDGEGICEYEPTSISCKANYYNNDGVCLSCAAIAGSNGDWKYSYGGTGGTEICHSKCSFACDPDLLCPDLATCTNVSNTINGGKFYPNTVCEPYEWLSCAVTFTCPEGYTARIPDGTDVNDLGSCDPNTYAVTLNDNGGASGSGTIYQKYKTGWYSNSGATSKITAVKVPTRTNYSFLGYYTAKTGGTKAIDSDGTILSGATYTATTTLYAQWSQNVNQCVAGKYYDAGTLKTCVAPYYCPGEGNVVVGGTGCRSTCPQDGYTIEGGQSAVTACHKSFNEGDDAEKVFDNGTATWDCTWVGTVAAGSYASCNINIADCDAGYYNPSGTLACSEVQSGHYSPDKDLDQTVCPAKSPYTVGSDGGTNSVRDRKQDCYIACASYIPTVSNSTSVYVTSDDYSKMYYATSDYAACQYTVECKTGYTPVSGATPACNAKEYTITLDKNGGSGNVASSVKCTFDSGKCALPATSGLTRAGYDVVAKWCTAADGTGTCYGAGSTVATNISATGVNTTLYAVWEPAVFEITLNASDADKNGAQGPVYLKYATGWYSDAAASKAMTSLGSALPEKGDGSYMFGGYKIGTVSIIDANGTLSTSEAALTVTTKDATANVVWAAGLTKCAAGTYYTGNGSTCAPCTANHYCPAGNYQTDSGTIGGLNACPNNGLSAGGTSATDITVCYKEKMAYTTYIDVDDTLPKAKGTWTCYYDTVGYTDCQEDTVEIAWCAGGYWYNAAQTKIDCSEVGKDNYSPEADLTKSACPDGGNTAGATTSDALSDCAKRVDTYESATGNAKGSYVCYARMDGSTVKYDQNCQTDTVQITWCKAGHWYDATQSKLDCVEVGLNNYGPVANASGHMIDKEVCPHDGTTTTTTASTPHATCKKTVVYPGVDYDGPAVHGSGLRGCYYDSMSDGKLFGEETSDGYLLNCDSITMTKCDAGYYWAARADTVCKVVDYGFYGPVADANNSNNPTARQACPDNGLTKTDTSADASACYLTDVACSVANGTGEHTCNYDETDAAYSANCTKCSVTGCKDGYSQVGDACINCPENSVCQDGNQRTCTVATSGTHPMSDAGTVDVAYCYKDCALVENAFEMSGRDYYGANVADTCKIAVCAEGYVLSNGKCVLCPEGFFCDPEGGDDPQACPSTHPASDAGASDKSDCYKVCEPYEVENGTAVPVKEHAFYPSDCEFKGVSISGNPCEIIDGVCVETACNYNFEMVNGVCKPCARENAITYKKNGNCVVESCASGYHPNGQMCEADVSNCTAPNAIAATQKWNAQKNAFGECIITECADGYHLAANACQIDEQVCELAHGIGVREWNHNTNTWGECIATKCDPGYTNDRSMTNELWEQCGRCNNMYSANGELAASSYVAECEIASCMYQGEKYALQNNECVLICDTYSDETGARRWDGKKCVTECEDGYMAW